MGSAQEITAVTPTYHDLLTPAGQIDRSVVMTLAIVKASQERAEYARLGLVATWRQLLSDALRDVWSVARQMRNGHLWGTRPAVMPVTVHQLPIAA